VVSTEIDTSSLCGNCCYSSVLETSFRIVVLSSFSL
jgi:hypothetical protein